MKALRGTVACGVLSTVAYTAIAWSHGRSASYARWDLDDRGAEVVARVSLLDLSRAGPPEDSASERVLSELLTSTLRLERGGQTCVPVTASVHPVSSDPGFASMRWRVQCLRTTGPRTLRAALFASVAPGHLHFASVHDPSGRVRERVLSEGDRSWALDDAASASSVSIAGFFIAGVHHILSGADHLAFLLVLALPMRRWRALLLAVTGFTLGHACSVTLAVAAGVTTNSRAVESLIGLSVALVAAEDFWLARTPGDPWLLRAPAVGAAVLAICAWAIDGAPALALSGAAVFALCTSALLVRGERPESLRAMSAGLFGLVHGFGFAGALAGLRPTRGHLALALVGFNLGVECGQLAVLLLAAPLLWLLWRARAHVRAVTLYVFATAGVALGSYWCVWRAFGQ